MKKKIVLLIIMSFLVVGAVSAASLWGSYKGNQIIRLTVDGVPVKVSDVPAISYQGRTMIPIYLLSQAGIKYSWDQKKQTVNVSKVVEADPEAIKEIPISWLKFYSGMADAYKQLDDFGDSIYVLQGNLFTTILLMQANNKPDDQVKSSEEMFNSVSADFNILKKSLEQAQSWSEENGYPSEVNNILSEYKGSLDNYELALKAIKGYRLDNNYYEDYLFYATKGDSFLTTNDKAVGKYNEFYRYLQDYK